MRSEPEATREAVAGNDVTIPGGCMLCGGDLAVRMTPAGARSVCKACRWISRPHMHREGEGVVVTHPAAGLA